MRTVKPAVHFVGFRGGEYVTAVRTWGLPDFIHPVNDARMRREIHAFDTVIYANGAESRPSDYNASDPDGLIDERRADMIRYGKLKPNKQGC